MAFPTSPSNGEIYVNATGTRYEYVSATDKWFIVNDTFVNSTEITRYAIQSAALTHHWRLDGNAIDSVNGYDLDVVGAPTYSDAIVNEGGVFDGTNDLLKTTTLTDLADDETGTINLWCKVDTDVTGDSNNFFSISRSDDTDNTQLHINGDSADNRMYYNFTIRTSAGGNNWSYTTEEGTLKLGEWTMLTMIQDGVMPRAYINGQRIDLLYTAGSDLTAWFKTIITDAASPCDTLGVGARFSNSVVTAPTDGVVDEVMIWNAALSDSEVRRLYASYNPENISSLVQVPIQGVDMGEDLKLYWPMDSTQGRADTPVTIKDYSGWGNHGTTAGSMTAADWLDGKYGDSLDFDGSDDALYNDNIGFLANDTVGTISIWVKPDGDTQDIAFSVSDFNTNYQTVFDIRSDGEPDQWVFRCEVDATNEWILESSTSSYKVGEWTHIVCVQDGTSPKMYINGVEDAGATFTTDTDKTKWMKDFYDATNQADRLTIGAVSNASTYANFFNGCIDEVRYYGRDLSAEEVWSLYNSSKPPVALAQENTLTDGLSGYWSFDEYVVTTYTTAYDYSNAAVPLSLTHASAPAVAQGKFGIAPHYDGAADYTSATMTSAVWASDTVGSISLWAYVDNDSAVDETFLSLSDASSNNQTRLNIAKGTTDLLSVYYEIDNSAKININTSGIIDPMSFATWYHITVVMDGVNAYFYVNGILIGSTACTDWIASGVAATNAMDTLTIGAWSNNGGREAYLDGLVDDVRIYSRPLSPKEIWNIYKGRR